MKIILASASPRRRELLSKIVSDFEIIPSNVEQFTRVFAYCKSMINPPTIPEKVTDLSGTFMGCTSLTTAPALHANVTNISSIFHGCTNLKTYVDSSETEGYFSDYKIPEGVVDMAGTFWECKSLVIPPEIPSTVTDMYGIFSYCSSLTTAPILPSGVTNIGGLFNDCTKLKTYVGSTAVDGDFSGYIIPEGAEDMRWTFNGCSLLTTAPVIPESVTSMYRTFYQCTLLTGTIQINTDKITVINSDRDIMNNGYNCFYATTKPIVLKGTGNNQSVLELLASTDNKNNVTVE